MSCVCKYNVFSESRNTALTCQLMAHAVPQKRTLLAPMLLLLGLLLLLHCCSSCRTGQQHWYLKGASPDHTDVLINRTNITSGGAVVHLISRVPMDDEQRTFWTQQRDNNGACNATTTSPNATTTTPTTTPQAQQVSVAVDVLLRFAFCPCALHVVSCSTVVYVSLASYTSPRATACIVMRMCASCKHDVCCVDAATKHCLSSQPQHQHIRPRCSHYCATP